MEAHSIVDMVSSDEINKICNESFNSGYDYPSEESYSSGGSYFKLYDSELKYVLVSDIDYKC